MSRSVRSVALILGAASFLLTATPVLAAPDQADLNGGSDQGQNTGPVSITLNALLPAPFPGFENTDRALLYIPNDRLPTLAQADLDSDGVHDCFENPPITGPRCYVDNVFTSAERTQSTLTAQFPTTNGVPSDQWMVRTVDSGEGDSWTCQPEGTLGCYTLLGQGPTMTSVTMAGGVSRARGQGSGPIAFTVIGTNFTPGTVVQETTDLADVTVTDVTRVSDTELRATLNVGPGAPVAGNVVRIANTANEGPTLDIDIVAGPTITSFDPASRGRGVTSRVIAITGENLVPGSTTFEVPPASGITIASQSVSSATAATMTIAIAADAPPGDVPVTAVEPTTGGRGIANLVINPDMTITSISPGGLRAGGQDKTVTLTGTNFREGLSVSISNTAKVAFDDAGMNLTVTETSVSFRVDVQPGAVQGDSVLITVDPNDGGTAKPSTILAIVGTPSVTTFSPASLGRGAVDAPLQMSGTNLDASASYAFSDGGITVGPCLGSTTQITCETDVTTDAALSARTLTITSAGESPTVIASPTLGVNAAPTITGLTDAIGQGATDHPVAVQGAGYVTGATVASDGLTVDGCTASAPGVACVVDLAGDAVTGPRSITIINGDFGRPDCAADACDLTVNPKPTVSAVAPDQLSRGAAAEIVATGEQLAATTVLSFGNGITVAPGGTVNPEGTELTVDVTVAADAAQTPRQATVVNADGGRSTSANVLDVLLPPQVLSIAPSHLGQGADDATVRVTGVGLADLATVSFGTKTSTVSVTPVGDDHTMLDVVLDVEADAPVGAAAHDVTVTNPDGNFATLVDGLTVDALPTVGALTPATIGQGAQAWPIHVAGTGFLPGATLDLGAGSLVTMVAVTPTGLDALVTLDGESTVGERDASVTNDNGGAPGVCSAASSDCFTISARPTLTSLEPASLGAGAEGAVVRVTGGGIVAGASLDAGDNVNAVNHADVDATTVDVALTIDHDAPLGPIDPVLINGDGGRSLPADDAFTILAPPTITSISPYQLAVGANTITISGSEFDPAATVSFGPGITVTTTTVSNGGATLTVEATLAANADVGIRDVRVTNPNAGSHQCLGCIAVGDPSVAVAGTSRGDLTEGATLRFFDRVTNVTPANVVIRQVNGPLVGTRMSCTDLDGNDEDCATSTDIRRVILRPIDHLVPGERYTVLVNPTAAASKVRDASADLAPASFAFRAARSVPELSPAVDMTWQLIRDPGALGDRYLRESRAGASMIVPFLGDDVTWISLAGPGFGRAKVAVDGVVVDTSVDASATRKRYDRRFTFRGFGAGQHLLEIIVLGKKGVDGKGTTVSFDGLIDDRGKALNPGGRSSWAIRSEPIANGDRVAIANLAGEKAMLPFRGTGIRIDMIAARNGGIVEVLVDGFSVTKANLYSANKRVFRVSITGLKDARHVVTLRVTGKRNARSSGNLVRLDHFAVRG